MKSDLEGLRKLRNSASPLLLDLTEDLRAFVNKENFTFRRRPEQASEADDVKVTTSCSCLMAVSLAKRFDDFYDPLLEAPNTSLKAVERAFNSVFAAKW